MRFNCSLLLALALFSLAAPVMAQTVERSGQGAVVTRSVEPQVLRGASPTPVPLDASQSGVARPAGASPETLIGQGWDAFKQGDWAAAERAFSQALESATGDTKQRARLGLGYASMRRGDYATARDNFEKAVQAGYNIPETLPALLTALKAQGDKASLARYVALLPESQRAQWAEAKPSEPRPAQEASGLRAAYAQAGANPSAAKLASLLAQAGQGGAACADADILLKIAHGSAALGQREQARQAIGKILACPKADFGIRLGAYYELANLVPAADVRAAIRQDISRGEALSARQQAQMQELAVVLDKREMGAKDTPDTRRLELARSILKADPADLDALAAVAWSDLNQKDYTRALEAFQALTLRAPERLDLRTGLGFSLLAAGRLDEALRLATDARSQGDPAMKDLAYQVYVKRGFAAVEAKDYAHAEASASAARAIWPQGREAREIEAWAAFGKGDNAKAYALFNEGYQSTGDKKMLSPMLMALSKDGQRTRAFETASGMARDADPQNRAAAADFYQANNAPMLSAAAGGGTAGCCTNADTQLIDARGFVRSRTGDSGLTRLTEWSVPVGYSWASGTGWRLGAALTASFLDSGKAPASPYAGSSYARVSGAPQRNSLVTNTTVYTPSLTYDLEGPYPVALQAGTTPIGGPIAPLPTFTANVSTPQFEVQAHQKAVTQTMLSWIGQRDPYGPTPWGRVLRTGGQAKYVFTPVDPYFISVGGSAEYYWGQNVQGNAGLKGNVSAGRTFDVLDSQVAAGVFGSVAHFASNENFSTYGHGGYYSPDLMLIAGPFLRLRAKECKDYWYDLEGSVGYLYERTASADKYPVKGASTVGLATSQLQDLGGRYSGKTETKFAYSAKGEVMKLFTPYFAAGAFGGVNNSADYTEAYGGIGVRLFLDPQKALSAPKSLLRYYTPVDRDS